MGARERNRERDDGRELDLLGQQRHDQTVAPCEIVQLRQVDRDAIDWPALAKKGQTIVFYMGKGSLSSLCAAMIAHGLPHEWPAALPSLPCWSPQLSRS